MKNRRIWLVILCILVVGVLVTRYTNSVISSRESKQEMAGLPGAGNSAGDKAEEAEAPQASATGAPETTAGAPAPAMAAAKESRTQPRTAGKQDMDGAQTEAGATSADAAAPAEAAAAADEAAPAAETLAAETAAEPAAGPGAGPGAAARAVTEAGPGPGAGPGAAADQQPASMPASPLEGVGGRPEYIALAPDTDYRQRLVDLDNQIEKLRKEDKDSSAYSLKASAESELRLWEGEMNTIYNALLDELDDEGAASLAAEQQEWMKGREARAVENNAKNGAGNLEGVGVTAALTALTRSRAYDLVDRYEELVQTK